MIYGEIHDIDQNQQIFLGVFVPVSIFNSIKATVYSAIKNRGYVNFANSVLRHRNVTLGHRQAICDFAQTTIDAIESNTFAPEKFTDPKGCRRFTLTPIHSFQLRNIPLNKQTLHSIATRAGLPYSWRISNEDFSRYLYQLFDFSTIGFHTLESLRTDQVEFE